MLFEVNNDNLGIDSLTDFNVCNVVCDAQCNAVCNAECNAASETQCLINCLST